MIEAVDGGPLQTTRCRQKKARCSTPKAAWRLTLLGMIEAVVPEAREASVVNETSSVAPVRQA
jgi:hypothetical protein